ncbi:MAG: hypothetical protein KME23_08000 [Goleter apudmare HA4340-LM2]|jgi:hypothetical protein|nr:hypothetical protein [Goleter apudmare HA4340-LM2]
MVCNSGDKPEITYQFGSKPERKYKSEFSPIEVVTKSVPVPGSGNYSNVGYTITFASSQCSGPCVFDVHDYKIVSYEGQPAVLPWFCGENNFRPSIQVTVLNTPNQTITRNNNSPCLVGKLERCSIQILHNGSVIFQDQGDCPVSYSVKCGNCPEGTEEIKTNIYPGYCCLDCAAVANEIKAITSIVKAIKNG